MRNGMCPRRVYGNWLKRSLHAAATCVTVCNVRHRELRSDTPVYLLRSETTAATSPERSWRIHRYWIFQANHRWYMVYLRASHQVFLQQFCVRLSPEEYGSNSKTGQIIMSIQDSYWDKIQI